MEHKCLVKVKYNHVRTGSYRKQLAMLELLHANF